jgi:Xaa-Pro aminopeptidase
MLTPGTLPGLQAELAELELDGWLLFEFQRTNPIALGVLGLRGMLTRRHLAYVPREGVPVAINHVIEPGAWQHWPRSWSRLPYSSWRSLEAALAATVGGKRIAMEYSPGNAIPYVDRVPAGSVEMVRSVGAEVVSSADLVTRFYATWRKGDLASHRRAAEVVAALGREALARAGTAAAEGLPLTERELQVWILEGFARARLETESAPIVAGGGNSAIVHHDASIGRSRPIREGDVLLVDLWAREPGGVYADQTWMGVLGTPDARVVNAWEAAVAARDVAIDMLRSGVTTGRALPGSEVYDVAVGALATRGYGDHLIGRVGHSIDRRDLHGAGPNLDNEETRDDRLLVPGTGFSIEPGIYILGEFGIRSEVNAFIAPEELVVTPREIQTFLMLV